MTISRLPDASPVAAIGHESQQSSPFPNFATDFGPATISNHHMVSFGPNLEAVPLQALWSL
jgi:hypothetical protein